MGLWNSAAGLLVVTGAFLSLYLPFGKIATAHGVAAPLWAFVISAGAAVLLFPALVARGELRVPTLHKLRYFFLTALVSYALPNMLLFLVIPRVGSGYAGIMFTLSPVITLGFAIVLGQRRPNLLGAAGLVIGFAGALIVADSRGEVGDPAGIFWIVLALCIPVLLSIGNIYRTMDWPPGTMPLELAIGSHAASALMLMAGTFVATGGFPVAQLGSVPLVTAMQAMGAAAMFLLYFRLQQVGGAVYLSQIGYVAAAIGLVVGTMLLGEHYAPATWAGAAVIVVGVMLTTVAQRAQDRAQAAG